MYCFQAMWVLKDYVFGDTPKRQACANGPPPAMRLICMRPDSSGSWRQAGTSARVPNAQSPGFCLTTLSASLVPLVSEGSYDQSTKEEQNWALFPGVSADAGTLQRAMPRTTILLQNRQSSTLVYLICLEENMTKAWIYDVIHLQCLISEWIIRDVHITQLEN